jgi:Tfp pilus assembly protein PilO
MRRSRTKKIPIEEKISASDEKIHKLEQLATELLETVRQLPSGTERHDLLKEIGRFSVRIAALRKSGHSTP